MKGPTSQDLSSWVQAVLSCLGQTLVHQSVEDGVGSLFFCPAEPLIELNNISHNILAFPFKHSVQS